MLSSCSVSVWMRKGMARPELSQESSWLELPSRSLVDKKGSYKRNSWLCNVIGFGSPFERHYGCKMISP